MSQNLTTDTVERYIEASPEALYDIIADVTRTPERTPDIVKCEWIDGATGPAVGARFVSTNHQEKGRGPDWKNKPVVTVADRGKEFSFTRTEKGGGTILWRHRFIPEGTGTRVVESYEVLEPGSAFGWFLIGTIYGLKDRRGDLHESIASSLDRLAEIAEAEAGAPAASQQPAAGS